MVKVTCDLCGEDARTPYLEVYGGYGGLRYHHIAGESHRPYSGIVCRDCIKKFLHDEEISKKGNAEMGQKGDAE